MGIPLFCAILIFFPRSIRTPVRVGVPVFGSLTITFDTWIGAAISRICPFSPERFGFVWRFFAFTFSTSTKLFLGNTRRIFPFFPLSFPVMTITLSPFLMFIKFVRGALYAVYRSKVFIFSYPTYYVTRPPVPWKLSSGIRTHRVLGGSDRRFFPRAGPFSLFQ